MKKLKVTFMINHRSVMQLAPWRQMQGYIIIEVCYIQTKWSYYTNLPHQIFQCKHTQGIAASLRSCLYILHPLVSGVFPTQSHLLVHVQHFPHSCSSQRQEPNLEYWWFLHLSLASKRKNSNIKVLQNNIKLHVANKLV